MSIQIRKIFHFVILVENIMEGHVIKILVLASSVGKGALVLFDSGATHSFVSCAFAGKLEITPETLNFQMCVKTPPRDLLFTKNVLRSCKTEINCRVLKVDLIILRMFDFDVTLGMDLLSTYQAKIMCFEKKIVFQPPDELEFSFNGSKLNLLPRVSTALQA